MGYNIVLGVGITYGWNQMLDGVRMSNISEISFHIPFILERFPLKFLILKESKLLPCLINYSTEPNVILTYKSDNNASMLQVHVCAFQHDSH